MKTFHFPFIKQKPLYSIILLLIILSLSIFSHGRLAIPFVTWILPIFALRFICIQKPLKGFLFLWLTMFLGSMITFNGVIPLLPIVVQVFIIAGFTLFFTIPYLIHRLVINYINHFLSTLVLPLAMVSIEFVVIIFSPYGSWTSYAYTQFHNSIVMQLASITGITGIVFVVFWFGSVTNWVIYNSCKWKNIKNGFLCFSLVLACITGYGIMRIGFYSPVVEESVRVALIAKDIDALHMLIPILNRDERITDHELQEIKRMMAQGNDFMFEKTAKEVAAGVKVVVWSEKAGFLFKPTFMTRIDKNNIY